MYICTARLRINDLHFFFFFFFANSLQTRQIFPKQGSLLVKRLTTKGLNVEDMHPYNFQKELAGLKLIINEINAICFKVGSTTKMTSGKRTIFHYHPYFSPQSTLILANPTCKPKNIEYPWNRRTSNNSPSNSTK